MKIQKITEITITEKQQQKVYDTIEWLLAYDFDLFNSAWKENWLWLGNIFLLLWILKSRWDSKATQLYNSMLTTHRKTKSNNDLKLREQEKIKDITTNKTRFINSSKIDLSGDQTLKILNKYTTELSNIVVIWIHYCWMNNENKFWWTSVVLESETPWIYKEIINKYHSYKDY